MTEKAATVHWEGQGKQGQGQISTETAALTAYPYGFGTVSIDTRASVRLSQKGDGFTIDRIALTLSAKVPGLDDAKFQEIAEGAKQNCPLSKALASVPEITLQATLQS